VKRGYRQLGIRQIPHDDKRTSQALADEPAKHTGSVSCVLSNTGVKHYLAMAEGFGLLSGMPKKKESDAALLARLKRELAKPHLAKSVRDIANQKREK
jgi:hypothetical protein